MTKRIETLVDDMNKVIDGEGGWDNLVHSGFISNLSDTVKDRLKKEDKTEAYRPTLRMSNLGVPCERKLWYHCNQPEGRQLLRPEVKFKFLFGDIIEEVILGLAKAAGHTVEGEQDELRINGIVGHRDAVIDGMTVDVKSASSRSFDKFKKGQLKENDPFGYVSQLSSYVFAGRDDPLVLDKSRGAFLVVDKQHGHICLDVHDLSEEVRTKEQEVDYLKGMVKMPTPPDRGFQPIPDGKSGNRKLPLNCAYCDFKHVCHPNLRTFLYSYGPQYLTTVKREPNVREVR